MGRPRVAERCYSCGSTMEGKVENYRYVECGLKTVTLKDILVFKCGKCGAVVPEIPSALDLHRIIGLEILLKHNRLTGDEVRFLRKLCGYSATDFAVIIGTSKSVVSRWENHSTFGKDSDRLVRLVCANKLIQVALAELTEVPDSEPRRTASESLVTALGQVIETLKGIQNKKGRPEQYMIDPKSVDLGLFLNSAPVTSEAVQ